MLQRERHMRNTAIGAHFMTDRLHILTGPPGSGKTSLLEALSGDIAAIPEPARTVITHQRMIDGLGTSDQDYALFVELMLSHAMEGHAAALRSGRAALFDRGVPDMLAYATYYGLDDSHIRRAAEACRYDDRIFWLPAWEDIYETDDERTMAFHEADAFGDMIMGAYDACGYELVEVPEGSVDERAEFVLGIIA